MAKNTLNIGNKTMEEKKTEVELLQAKIDNAISRLRGSREKLEEEVKKYAVYLAEKFGDEDEHSKKMKNKYYLEYSKAKTQVDTFTASINTIEATLAYG